MRAEVAKVSGGSSVDGSPRPLRLALAVTIAITGCVTANQDRPVPIAQKPAAVPPADPSPARAVAPPPAPAESFQCEPRDREYEKWFGDVFGRGLEVIQDGPDPRRLTQLSPEERARAVIMLHRGLRTCDTFAVEAMDRAGWRDLVPDLERATAAKNVDFRVHVILALRALGGTDDHTEQLIAVLRSGSQETRMTAAIGARHFELEQMREPLLDRVRRDPSSLVRHHAAESLLDLADIYPRSLYEHASIVTLMVTPNALNPSVGSLLGFDPPPGPDELARFAEAARRLDAAITQRLAAGPCPKATPLDSVSFHVLPVKADPHLVALAVEQSVGPCERTLSFVVFLRSAGGFGRWLDMGSMSRNPLKRSIETLPTPLAIEYDRTLNSFKIGRFVLDASRVNVAVLSSGDKGVVAEYQSKQSLTFERHGRPAEAAMELLSSAPEVIDEVRALLNRTPELAALVGPGTPPR